jgi:CrcB protein
MHRLLLICFAGAIGTGARYIVGGLALKAFGSSFPFGTLIINFAGSFVLAVVMALGTTTELISVTTRLTLATGFCGGFTTYSTFSYDTFKYFQEGAWGLGLANILATLIGCLFACLLGFAGARSIAGP